MDILHMDEEIIVCVKEPGLLSTDEPGGLPPLLREELKDPKAGIYTVHRLDRVVGGLMLLARSSAAAGALSRQMREGSFEKRYLALVHGETAPKGEMRDLLFRDRARKMTFVAEGPGKGVQEALLSYERLGLSEGEDRLSLVKIELHTGRTHQIRCQFASRGLPLVGERKYSTLGESCGLALWSYSLSFVHPASGKKLSFSKIPPSKSPWDKIPIVNNI